MKVVIAGGSGQVGTILSRAFATRGDEVVVLARRPKSAPWRVVTWDAATLGDWAQELEGAGVVINLAGRSVNCRYTPENRREIVDSRVRSTRAVGQAIAACSFPPPVWLQASTATIYAHRYDAPNDDVSGIIGGDEADVPESWRFSIEVARAWEEALSRADTPRTRKVALRAAMIMSADRGGVFAALLGLVRRGLGGPAGDGRQFMSWVHQHDFTRALWFLIEHSELDGAVAIAAPQPLPNREFVRALREAWGTRVGLPATEWMLEVGAWFLRTETELILKSRRVVSRRLLDAGFEFEFPSWPEAARELCDTWRRHERGVDNADEDWLPPIEHDGIAALEIEDSIDLHGFQPRDIPAVVESYLEAAAEKGFFEVRLIHGRGKGVQRARVQELLGRHPLVASFRDAPAARGGWGATIALLKRPPARE